MNLVLVERVGIKTELKRKRATVANLILKNKI